jgi:hypothetical protein
MNAPGKSGSVPHHFDTARIFNTAKLLNTGGVGLHAYS